MALPRATKNDLTRSSDLVTRDVDLESIGFSVQIRSLSAAFSNEVFEKATDVMVDGSGEQQVRVNPGKYQFLQVLHGLADPQLDSLDEVAEFAAKVGPAWKALIEAIDEISEIDGEAVKKTDTLFRAGGQEEEQGTAEEHDASAGDGGSDLPVRVGVAAGDVSE